jgi:hypothetical protein
LRLFILFNRHHNRYSSMHPRSLFVRNLSFDMSSCLLQSFSFLQRTLQRSMRLSNPHQRIASKPWINSLLTSKKPITTQLQNKACFFLPWNGRPILGNTYVW